MINLFLVDDHEIIREGFKRILNFESDMKVVGEADNGNDVISGISETDCDILVLDLNIPGLQGVPLIKRVMKVRPDIRILILSMVPVDKFVLPILRAGAMGFVSKDSKKDELLNAIRKIYNNGRYLNEDIAEKLAHDILTDNTHKHRELSNQEQSILLLIAKGKQYSVIAEELGVSTGSVAVSRRRILEKLSLDSNFELTQYVLKNHLIFT